MYTNRGFLSTYQYIHTRIPAVDSGLYTSIQKSKHIKKKGTPPQPITKFHVAVADQNAGVEWEYIYERIHIQYTYIYNTHSENTYVRACENTYMWEYIYTNTYTIHIHIQYTQWEHICACLWEYIYVRIHIHYTYIYNTHSENTYVCVCENTYTIHTHTQYTYIYNTHTFTIHIHIQYTQWDYMCVSVRIHICIYMKSPQRFTKFHIVVANRNAGVETFGLHVCKFIIHVFSQKIAGEKYQGPRCGCKEERTGRGFPFGWCSSECCYDAAVFWSCPLRYVTWFVHTSDMTRLYVRQDVWVARGTMRCIL